jgi:uncharacterized protein (TIGR00369 family)
MIDIVSDQLCFGCGQKNDIGLKLVFRTEDGKSFSDFILDKNFQGYQNMVHGGIIATIMDEAMVHAAISEKLFPVTAEMTVRYIKPVYVEQQLTVKGWLAEKGSRKLEARAQLIDRKTGAVCAESSAKLVLPR